MARSSEAAVHVNTDGVVFYNGDPTFGEEYEERVWLSFFSMRVEDQATVTLRLKNGLTARAWELVHSRDEIAATKLLADGKVDAAGTLSAFLNIVRSSCEKVAPIRKKEAFDGFFESGRRRPGEGIQDFIARRENEYSRLKTLSSTTALSEDLRTYFLMKMASIDEATHRAILGQCSNEYSWDAVTAAMQIQLDRPTRTEHAPASRFGGGHRRWTPAYDAEAYEGDAWQEDGWQSSGADAWAASSSVQGYDEYEGEADPEGVAEDVDELEQALAILEPQDLADDEVQTFAAEAQRLGAAARGHASRPSYKQARENLARGRQNRGWSAEFDRNGAPRTSRPISRA